MSKDIFLHNLQHPFKKLFLQAFSVRAFDLRYTRRFENEEIAVIFRLGLGQTHPKCGSMRASGPSCPLL